MRHVVIATALAVAALPAAAQAPAGLPTSPPGKPDPKLVVAGTYRIEPLHTQLSFSLDHLGFTPYQGAFESASGSLTIDPKALGATRLSITVPIASVHTPSAKLNEELVAAQFFDAQKFPTATFVSTGVKQTGPISADVTGNLTLHGVTRPLTLKARFYGAGTNFMSKKPAIGFIGTGQIRRSDFGVGYGVPLVGDAVTLSFAAAFEQ